MRYFSFHFVLFVMGICSGFLFSNNLVISKAGECGSKAYVDIFVVGDYAYCAAEGQGLDIAYIGDPTNPKIVKSMEMLVAPWRIQISNNYAYVIGETSNQGAALQIMDVRNPVSPTVMGKTDLDETHSLYISGNYAYITANDRLRIINVANRDSPKLNADFQLSPEGPYPYSGCWALDVYVQGKYAYLAVNQWFGHDDDDYIGMVIVDVSNPRAPQQVNLFQDFGGAQYPLAICVQGSYAYLASRNGLFVLDVSNPEVPEIIGFCDDCDSSNYFYGDIKVQGNYVFLASSNKGLNVASVANPKVPNRVGRFYNIPQLDRYDGVLGTFVKDNYIYLAYRSAGSGELIVASVLLTSPQISANPEKLIFGSQLNTSDTSTEPQTLSISNSGVGTLNWSVAADKSWLNCSPTSGINSGLVSVSVNTTGLAAGTYNGTITISDPNAFNSPLEVEVILMVYRLSELTGPFGEFATPTDGSTVSSSIPVTGWALDDIMVESVRIYRGEAGNIVYIGDGVFVEGARPDVEQAYPESPMNYKAGWGYMMLTNFLPNGGNGTFKIHAIATDIDGHKITLGTKTIICDNANAVKPFGAIDTPTQGGTASGNKFINWGWALTPQPNSIPIEGSTINVYVDGVNLGHPTYNIYRSDISQLFPGYNNSDGAAGYFSMDTTSYTNGVHTIQWTATDSDGNSDGIGSRYFTIHNTGNSQSKAQTTISRKIVADQKFFHLSQIVDIPLNNSESIRIKRGLRDDIEPEVVISDESGAFIIKTEELERIVIELSTKSAVIEGYTIVENNLRPLPIGSTLDTRKKLFYWQPGPGFFGEYRFVFVEKMQNGEIRRNNVIIKIEPKFSKR